MTTEMQQPWFLSFHHCPNTPCTIQFSSVTWSGKIYWMDFSLSSGVSSCTECLAYLKCTWRAGTPQGRVSYTHLPCARLLPTCTWQWRHSQGGVVESNLQGPSRKYPATQYEKQRLLLKKIQDTRNIVHRTMMPILGSHSSSNHHQLPCSIS